MPRLGPRGDEIVVHPGAADPATWHTFVRAIEAALPRLQLLVLGIARQSDADDLVGDTLLAATKYWHTYDGRRPMLPWLWTIAKRLSRRHRGPSVVASVPQMATEAEPGADPAEMLDRATLSSRVDRALAALTHSQQRVLLQVALDGTTLREAAQGLGVSENAAECLLRRARSAFIRAYGPEG